MHLCRILQLSFLFWPFSNLATAKYDEEMELLQEAVNALYTSLQYMENSVSVINLDGAFGCRLTEEILHAFLASRPDIFDRLGHDWRDRLELLRVKAGRIADDAKPYIKKDEPLYYATVGGLLDKNQVMLWYPGRLTQPSLLEVPLPCSESIFNETQSDQCLQGIIGTKARKDDSCTITDGCIEMMIKPRMHGYMITHQVLYFQLLELNGCLRKSQVVAIPEHLQDALCTNVLRDAEEIAASDYPLNHRDLFMEQIGLCGFWGYKDFYKNEWLQYILQWQDKSGCYANFARWKCTENVAEQKIRNKRNEKVLEGGCLSHKTAVALVALSSSIRFSIEKMFDKV